MSRQADNLRTLAKTLEGEIGQALKRIEYHKAELKKDRDNVRDWRIMIRQMGKDAKFYDKLP